MKLVAIKINQNGKELFVTKMTAEMLADKTKILADIWGPKNPEGYQRIPNKTRAAKFSKYVRPKTAPAPQPVLLSIREKVYFKDGFLEFPDAAKLYEVDGQHRIEGLRLLVEKDPGFKDFEMSVVVLPSVNWLGNHNPKFEEAIQFQTINKTQKTVRTDLTERFLARLVEKYADDKEKLMELPPEITRGIEYVPKAIEITEKLNSLSGPWKEKIQFPNQGRGLSVVSQKSFTDSLRPIVTNESLQLKSQDSGTLAELLNRYWSAIADLCPEAFGNPSDHLIQKTTGVFVLNSFFIPILSYVHSHTPSATITKEMFKEVLQKVKYINSDDWHRKKTFGKMGTNRKAFSLVSQMLEAEFSKKVDRDISGGAISFKL